MIDFDSPGDLLRAYSTRAKKRFGQHFLTDPNVLQRIVDLAGVVEGDSVLEIGPGCGTLTWQLVNNGARVTAIEIDRDAVAFLESVFGDTIEIVEGDAAEIDLEAAIDRDRSWKVVANLPYNVATAILFRLLESEFPFDRLTLMFQKEVADRICAGPDDDAYGALSLRVALRAEARREMRLKGGAFTPPPRVESAVVVLEPIRGTRIIDDPLRQTFLDAVEAGFALRRKTLRNALKRVWETGRVEAAIEQAGLDPRIRAEKLGFEQFLAIARSLHAGEGDQTEKAEPE